ncbi:hypothetical protein [Segetibacter koreensis]|uniref:hypothetical protein n=1 Tax=Segetibacter koreensis TaxID=398037 RepID=UPI00036F03CA|nr:hypothetical protein [Segetibacter koreensis]
MVRIAIDEVVNISFTSLANREVSEKFYLQQVPGKTVAVVFKKKIRGRIRTD